MRASSRVADFLRPAAFEAISASASCCWADLVLDMEDGPSMYQSVNVETGNLSNGSETAARAMCGRISTSLMQPPRSRTPRNLTGGFSIWKMGLRPIAEEQQQDQLLHPPGRAMS